MTVRVVVKTIGLAIIIGTILGFVLALVRQPNPYIICRLLDLPFRLFMAACAAFCVYVPLDEFRRYIRRRYRK